MGQDKPEISVYPASIDSTLAEQARVFTAIDALQSRSVLPDITAHKTIG